jgi:tetratricopeptide (TPR) repeat protein
VKTDLERIGAAIEDFDEGLRRNPQYAVAFNNRGFAKAKLGRFKDAIPDFDQALRIDPHLRRLLPTTVPSRPYLRETKKRSGISTRRSGLTLTTGVGFTVAA